jgi:hypothetical protein
MQTLASRQRFAAGPEAKQPAGSGPRCALRRSAVATSETPGAHDCRVRRWQSRPIFHIQNGPVCFRQADERETSPQLPAQAKCPPPSIQRRQTLPGWGPKANGMDGRQAVQGSLLGIRDGWMAVVAVRPLGTCNGRLDSTPSCRPRRSTNGGLEAAAIRRIPSAMAKGGWCNVETREGATIMSGQRGQMMRTEQRGASRLQSLLLLGGHDGERP